MLADGLAERLAGRLTRGRAAAEARMLSRVAVMRKTGLLVQDEDSGLEVPQWATVHVDLPFRLDGGASSDGGSRTISVAGVEYEQATAVGHMPAGTTDLADADHIEVVTGEWAGTVWSVIKAVLADQKTARRVPIESVQRPEEWA